MPLPKNSNICVSSSWILIVVSPYYGHIFLLICIPGDFFYWMLVIKFMIFLCWSLVLFDFIFL